MKKISVRKFISFVLALIAGTIIFTATASAASYPSLIPDEYSKTAYVGDVVEIKYIYYPVYKNEKIVIYVYDKNNKQVASAERSFYHTEYKLTYTVTWDTEGEKTGEYKVVAHKYFYTLNEWYEAPTTTTSYIDLKSADYCANNSHTFSYYTTTKEATCTESGLKERECKNCPYKEKETIPALGHSYASEVIKNATCTTAGQEKKTCSVCDYSYYATITAIGHSYSYSVTEQATCTSSGKRTGVCSICGDMKDEVYPATGHISDSGKVIKEPTYTTTGEKVYYCTECGAVVKTETIAKNSIPVIKSLKVTSVTDTSIKLSIGKVDGATKYIVYYSTNGSKWTSVTTTKNTVTIKELKSGTNYQIKACVNIDGNNGKTCDIIKTSTKVSKVTINTAKTMINANISLTWKKVTGASGYVVEYSTSKSFPSNSTKKVTIKSGSTIKTTLEKLTNNKKYYIRIRAYKTVDGKAVYGAYSSTKTVTAKATVSISKTKANVYLGKKLTLNLLNSSKKNITSGITWKTSDKKIATVNSSGVVTAKKAGTAKITATYKNVDFVCTVTVKPTVSVNKTKLTFEAGSTSKKSVTVTFKESGSVFWEIVKGSDIINCEWSRKWDGDTTKLYVTLDGDEYGEARIKIYAKDNPSRCAYIDVVVAPPITLKVVNKLPCIVGNYEADDYYDEGEEESKVKITKVDYEVLYGDSLNIVVDFTAYDSYYDEGYYYFTYRILDEDGYVVEFDRVMSERMYKGDKSKEEIYLWDLEKGDYTIEFIDHYAED